MRARLYLPTHSLTMAAVHTRPLMLFSSRGAIANAHHASTSRADRAPSALASISRWPEAVSSSVPEPRCIWRHSTDGIQRPRRILGQAARCVLRGWAEGDRPGRTVAMVPPSRIRLTTKRGPPVRRSSHADVSMSSFRTPLGPWAQASRLIWLSVVNRADRSRLSVVSPLCTPSHAPIFRSVRSAAPRSSDG